MTLLMRWLLLSAVRTPTQWKKSGGVDSMIGYLRGTVDQLLPEACYIDVQGVGYRVYIPTSTRDKLTCGMEIKLYTYLNVREDALLLFGFFTMEEHELFLLLLTVTGVGPKMALAILSGIKPEGIRTAIGRKDLPTLTRISGVGKKTAERIVLELRDKIGEIGMESICNQEDDLRSIDAGSSFDEAMAALVSLGYQQGEVSSLLKKISGTGKTTEELIRSVLREVGGRK
jgi:Holliday junction DNA helicase RuvA